MNDPNSGESDGTIRIVLPADPRFLAALRVAIRAAAALGDLDPDDIEDMQIAADEAATLLLDVVPPGPTSDLTAELTVGERALLAAITVPCAPRTRIATDGLAWMMLTSLDPGVSVVADGTVVSIVFGRNRAEP